MVHECRVLSVFPVDAIRLNVVDLLVLRDWMVLDPARAVVIHAEEKHISWAAIALTADLQGMIIPGVCPLLRVLVDKREE